MARRFSNPVRYFDNPAFPAVSADEFFERASNLAKQYGGRGERLLVWREGGKWRAATFTLFQNDLLEMARTQVGATASNISEAVRNALDVHEHGTKGALKLTIRPEQEKVLEELLLLLVQSLYARQPQALITPRSPTGEMFSRVSIAAKLYPDGTKAFSVIPRPYMGEMSPGSGQPPRSKIDRAGLVNALGYTLEEALEEAIAAYY